MVRLLYLKRAGSVARSPRKPRTLIAYLLCFDHSLFIFLSRSSGEMDECEVTNVEGLRFSASDDIPIRVCCTLDVQLSRCSIQVKYSATAVDRPARELVRTTGSNPEGGTRTQPRKSATADSCEARWLSPESDWQLTISKPQVGSVLIAQVYRRNSLYA
jgi:hypothetical protein